MDKREHRQLRMVEFIDALYPGRGGVARMARDCGIADTYLRRLAYPPHKRGSKGLGEDTIEALESHYQLPRGWFDMPIGTPVTRREIQSSRDTAHVQASESAELPLLGNSVCMEPATHSSAWQSLAAWPFPDIDKRRWDALGPGLKRAAQARFREILGACEAGLIEPLPDTPRSKRSA